MLKSFRAALALSVITLSAFATSSAFAAPLKVVASFTVIADFAKNVGGDRVNITTIVGPDGDAHVYEPTPADAVAMAGADVVLVNGLHFEGFLQRLVDTSATKATIVTLTKGVTPIAFKPEFADA
ncbi:MAG: metal ABC transporter substrate-binding protein, partial [Mesorhizobium sp.]